MPSYDINALHAKYAVRTGTEAGAILALAHMVGELINELKASKEGEIDKILSLAPEHAKYDLKDDISEDDLEALTAPDPKPRKHK